MSHNRLTHLKTLITFGLSAAVLIVAGGYAVRGAWPWRTRGPATPVTVTDLFRESLDTLRRGETVSELFARQGLDDFSLSDSAARELFDPRRLRPGLVFSFKRRPTDSLPEQVTVRMGPAQRVTLYLTADGWHPVAEAIAWRSEPVTVKGQITTSLYDALDTQISDTLLQLGDRIRLAWDLADVFAWQVDFSRDIRPGDSFRVLAERLVSETGEIRFGKVLAGDLVVGGVQYTAYRYTAPDGGTGYYDAEGRSLRRAFLLAPVSFRRISSRFNRARFHPILRIVRRHEGTDFAADPGTPVMAAGDGTVIRRGWAGGYGNLVELRHGNGITTRYGHLRAFANRLAVGSRVSQGDVIGYVGSTGLASGPHLHYEFRVNGVSRDPRKADYGTGDPVPVALIRDFDRERARLGALLAWADGPLPALAGDVPWLTTPVGTN